MRNICRFAALLVIALGVAGCANTRPPKDYTAFQETAPRSILVVPVTNASTQVDAPDNFLATLPIPLAERGYYVFPINLVKHQMEDNGLSDANLVHSADTRKLAAIFGADAVLYANIEMWDSQYLVVSTTTTVTIHYVLKSAKTGGTIWEEKVNMKYTPEGGNTGNPLANLIAGAIRAAVERAKPNYIPLANQANRLAIYTKDQGIPAGPYDAAYVK